MKFGKDFKKQMVPEWVEAYMDYNGLKGILREVRSFRKHTKPAASLRSLQRSFSGLSMGSLDNSSKGDVENQAIDVSAIPGESNMPVYKTNLLMPPEEAGDAEVNFFRELDKELNKVNMFFRGKVEEIRAEGDKINKQMDALVAFRIKLRSGNSDSNALTNGTNSTEVIPSSSTSNSEDPASNECIKENEQKQAPVEILDRVEINPKVEKPLTAIKNFLKDSRRKSYSFKKEELKAAEDRMKLVLTEFYHQLRQLKQYSYMNLSAFSKILKKYEKIAARFAAKPYMKIVDRSYIGNSDEVNALLVKVEELFSKHFFNANRREGMKLLRHKRKTEKHSVTFFTGFFTGCAGALVVAIVLIMNARKMINDGEGIKYLNNMFQLYSLFAYLVLHMLTYAANIYFWKRYRVNYAFIFNFKPGTELGFREVLLLSTGLGVLALAGLLVNFHMIMESRALHHQDEGVFALAKLTPLILVVIVLVITVCPLNIVYRSSRMFLIKYMFRCICTPLYELPSIRVGSDAMQPQVHVHLSYQFLCRCKQ